MSKGNAILGSVRIGSDVFVAGQEDALAAVITPEQVVHLTKEGAIIGDFKGGKKSEPVADQVKEPAEETEAEDSEKEAPKGKK